MSRYSPNTVAAVALVAGAAFGLAAGFPLGWISKPNHFTITPVDRPMTEEQKQYMGDQWKAVVESAEQARREDAAAERAGVNRRGGR